MSRPLPRFVIAAPASGHGKTTVASGLMAALRARGRSVAPFKVGPDYIDPGYHTLATGRAGRNLDPVLCPGDLITPLLLHGSRTPEPADLAVIEGVMGLFDGQLGTQGYASTAHIAQLTGSPIILVVDISHTSRTVAALVHGLATFEPGLHIAGVIFNKAGSVRHSDEAVAAMAATGVPVLGVLQRDAGITAPSRHLGLVPVAERDRAEESLGLLAEQIAGAIDLAAVERIAQQAAPLTGTPWDPAAAVARIGDSAPVVAVAAGRAFTFRYPETTELLTATGCRVVEFDPLTDPDLPAGTSGLYLGGGFPQVYAESLGANHALADTIAARVAAGLPTVAECAGLLYLSRTLDRQPMAGVLPTDAAMHRRLTLGYRTAIAPADTLVARAGERLRGHEFHRTRTDPGAGPDPAWLLDGTPEGFSLAPTGVPSVHASYLHTHWAGHPQSAYRFATAVFAHQNTGVSR
ncbi:cobyrinate a,c-diamide synthase [Granulicoccus phenolivorans]|uniref:cobyrinate a,c-diamide synthase n=1 Tax=Granulicoccus phenolivorans TaxID=266854 RepID=UPI00041FFB73|nr:cobyrinate a,c-diamide synthase [Granulicoccus phenolivorans]